jgi:hypothetical protein
VHFFVVHVQQAVPLQVDARPRQLVPLFLQFVPVPHWHRAGRLLALQHWPLPQPRGQPRPVGLSQWLA